MRTSYDMYSKKNLGIMHMVKRYGGWDFRNFVERGNPKLAKSTVPKALKKVVKQTLIGSSILLIAASFMVEHKVDLVVVSIKQLQKDSESIKETLQLVLEQKSQTAISMEHLEHLDLKQLNPTPPSSDKDD